MTPLEIFEYKNKWMLESNYYVVVNEDLDFTGKLWCRQHLKQHEWHFLRYTDMYDHTFVFEKEQDKNSFSQYIESLV